MAKRLVAILIPAHNEEKVLASTLDAILAFAPREDVYVVDDCSSDATSEIAKKFTEHVLALPHNYGKAGALNTALDLFAIPKRYEFILFMDADTRPDNKFIQECMGHFASDVEQKISCVVGRVQGEGGSWVGKYRLWEYTIAHSIHKPAQEYTSSILVVPGCATMYRSKVFNLVKIPGGTYTEDMDLTFLLHRMGFSGMVFEPNAVVYTQDPQTLRDFMKQVHRWYVGFWQVVRKHDLPWGGQNLDYEVAILATEGLINGFVSIALLCLLPLLFMTQTMSILLVPVALDFFVFFLPSLVWSSYKTKDYSLSLYVLHFYFLRVTTSLLFLKSFFIAYLSRERMYSWNTARYARGIASENATLGAKKTLANTQ